MAFKKPYSLLIPYSRVKEGMKSYYIQLKRFVFMELSYQLILSIWISSFFFRSNDIWIICLFIIQRHSLWKTQKKIFPNFCFPYLPLWNSLIHMAELIDVVNTQMCIPKYNTYICCFSLFFEIKCLRRRNTQINALCILIKIEVLVWHILHAQIYIKIATEVLHENNIY